MVVLVLRSGRKPDGGVFGPVDNRGPRYRVVGREWWLLALVAFALSRDRGSVFEDGRHRRTDSSQKQQHCTHSQCRATYQVCQFCFFQLENGSAPESGRCRLS